MAAAVAAKMVMDAGTQMIQDKVSSTWDKSKPPEFTTEVFSVGGLIPESMLVSLLLLLSLLLIFAGYRAIKVIVSIAGALLGGVVTQSLFASILVSAASAATNNKTGSAEKQHDLVYVAFFVGAVVGAVLTYYLFQAGLFLVGAAAGLVAGSFGVQWLTVNVNLFIEHEMLRYVVIVGIAVVCGLLALVFNRVFLIPSTAFLGSFLFVSVLDHFRGGPLAFHKWLSSSSAWSEIVSQFECDGWTCYLILVFWCLLFGLGVMFQFNGPSRRLRAWIPFLSSWSANSNMNKRRDSDPIKVVIGGHGAEANMAQKLPYQQAQYRATAGGSASMHSSSDNLGSLVPPPTLTAAEARLLHRQKELELQLVEEKIQRRKAELALLETKSASSPLS